MKFNASQFTPPQWESPKQKTKFVNHFVKFTESDFRKTENIFNKSIKERKDMNFLNKTYDNL